MVQVLRFYGYFKESVVESNIENHRVRKVILYYYLEDDSMHVAEPRQDNSGIPQVRRGQTSCEERAASSCRSSSWDELNDGDHERRACSSSATS